MSRFAIRALFALSCVASAQDIFSSQGGGQGEDVPHAFQKLYKITVTITDSPSSGYDPKTSRWPNVDQVQKDWYASWASHGNQVTPAQRSEYTPCGAHLNNAIDSAERGYRIQISQQGNPPAQKTAQDLFASGRAELGQCRDADEFNNNDIKRPPGVGPPGSAPPSPGKSSGSPPPDYVKGLTEGIGTCGQIVNDAAGAIEAMKRGDFVTAARLLGIRPGESVTLRGIYQVYQDIVNTNQIGISPYEAGRIAGTRICTYFIVPEVSGRVGGGVGKTPGKPGPAPTPPPRAGVPGAPPPRTQPISRPPQAPVQPKPTPPPAGVPGAPPPRTQPISRPPQAPVQPKPTPPPAGVPGAPPPRTQPISRPPQAPVQPKPAPPPAGVPGAPPPRTQPISRPPQTPTPKPEPVAPPRIGDPGKPPPRTQPISKPPQPSPTPPPRTGVPGTPPPRVGSPQPRPPQRPPVKTAPAPKPVTPKQPPPVKPQPSPPPRNEDQAEPVQ